MRIKAAYAYKMGYDDQKAGRSKQKGFQSGMERRLYNDGWRHASEGLPPQR